MSKLDAQRAMREAKYAQDQARAQARAQGRTTASPRPTVAPRAVAPAATSSAPAPAVSSAVETCGHRSMNGRTCTREHGHSEKSHRYS